jgi:hypothetical protein
MPPKAQIMTTWYGSFVLALALILVGVEALATWRRVGWRPKRS